jgi:hypothetical protein
MTFLKHPSRNYVKYLLLSKQDVNINLSKYDLPTIKTDILSTLKIDTPENFDPFEKDNKESLDFIRNEKIHGLFFPDIYTNEAFKYLTDYSVRDSIEMFLLAKMPSIEIAKKLNGRWQIFATSDGISRYRHYFWDITVMRIKDWMELYKDPKDKTKIKNIIKHGPNYALSILGFLQKLEAKEALRDIMNTCVRAAKEISEEQMTPEIIKSLAILAQTIDKIDDKLSSGVETNKDIMKRYEKYSIEQTNTQIKSFENTINDTIPLTQLEQSTVTYTRENLLDSKKEFDEAKLLTT